MGKGSQARIGSFGEAEAKSLWQQSIGLFTSKSSRELLPVAMVPIIGLNDAEIFIVFHVVRAMNDKPAKDALGVLRRKVRVPPRRPKFVGAEPIGEIRARDDGAKRPPVSC